jgi:EAL domain-containing protein (putative c-di-GMP-specific phosphodiesterase class I)
MISPNEFIPIAEQTGAIVDIGRYVLQQAIENTRHWRNILEQDFQIAINLSPRQLRDAGLIDFVNTQLQRNELKADAIILEVTEGVLMTGQQDIEQALMRLQKAGISLAMDDFGTGYSSLSYLRMYPFDVLKVDRTFVSDITDDPANRELVTASVMMAHGLGLKVVAEGVETESQLKLLHEIGCEYAQGYLFSRPVDADTFTNLLQERSSTMPPTSLQDTLS